MKKYEGKSIRKGKTNTGAIPDGVGCCRPNKGGGYIRKLTKADLQQQKRNLATLNIT